MLEELRSCYRCGKEFVALGRNLLCEDCYRKPVKSTTLPTLREHQVIELLCEGLPNKEIAARLHLTMGTVRTYIYLLFKKYGVDNRTQMALKFQKLKMALHPPVE